MIALVGSGNVATHLFKAISPHVDVTIVNSHSLTDIPPESDVILISVSDRAIKEVAERIKGINAIVAHTSGSIPMEVLKNTGNKIGVFYPLQTFSKGSEIIYNEIPLFLEGSSPETLQKLQDIGSLFTDRIYFADSLKRKQLHLASVFACNFTNALAGISEKLIEGTGFNFNVLQPLMKQTIKKLEIMTPHEAQTGPAVRGDEEVMKCHLEMLSENKELKNLYCIFSDYIKHQS